MKPRFWTSLLALLVVLTTVLSACQAPAAAPRPGAAADPLKRQNLPRSRTDRGAGGPRREGRKQRGLRATADAAPLDKQVFRLAADDAKWAGWDSKRL